jgi:lipid-A-disaccharide synthase
MRAAGADTIDDLVSHAAMLTNSWKLLPRALRAISAARRAWEERRPDVVVMLDSSLLHLKLGFARSAKRRNLPVLYYIAPQTWASREGRNRRIARDVDRVASILPFEEDFFRSAGIPADFVGHPLFETLAQQSPDARRVAAIQGADPPQGEMRPAVIALMPGSRRAVVESVLPMQVQIVRRLATGGRSVRVAVSAASSDRAGQIGSILNAASTDMPVEAHIIQADNASLLTAADLVLVASGTATLEVAAYRKPMIVMYDGGPLLNTLTPPLRRFLIKTPHFALVNILAGARIVPEFVPCVRDPDAVATLAARLLDDPTWRRLMIRQLGEVVAPLAATSPSARVCDIIEQLTEQSAQPSCAVLPSQAC